jgi:hypothetical protein
MKELAKSLTSLTWAMSLLGAQQALQLAARQLPGTGQPAPSGLGPLAQAGAQQLTGAFRRTFEAGDQLQRSATDLMFGMLTLEALQPNRLATLSADLVRQSTAALRSLLPGGDAAPFPAAGGACGGAQPCGWGPMPPAK